eukprot:m.314417 g.314417  ORF g.314417 m.314417 type:complete len:204 (-) comp20266_c0_seq8:168-779(-)
MWLLLEGTRVRLTGHPTSCSSSRPVAYADKESLSHTGNASAAYYMGDGSEHYATSGHEFKPCATPGCKTVGELAQDFWSILAPIFVEFGVDVYNAGHVHSYEAHFPVCKDSKPCQYNYINPKGPVHITEGNGGVPGVPGSNGIKGCAALGSSCRVTGTGGAYARITAWNATHMTYDHVENPTGNVTDSFTIIQTNHGPFNPLD